MLREKNQRHNHKVGRVLVTAKYRKHQRWCLVLRRFSQCGSKWLTCCENGIEFFQVKTNLSDNFEAAENEFKFSRALNFVE